jgi:hypothetical protein
MKRSFGRGTERRAIAISSCMLPKPRTMVDVVVITLVKETMLALLSGDIVAKR